MKRGFVILVGLIVFSCTGVFAQSAKQHVKAGEQFFQNGMVEAAIEEFEKAIHIDPNDGRTYSVMANVLVYNRDSLKAAKKYKRAGALGFEPGKSYFQAAQIYYVHNNTEEALNCIELGLGAKPKDIDLLLLKSKYFFDKQNYSRAYQVSGEALRSKDLALAYYYHGASAYKLGLESDAKKNLEKAIIRDKNLVEAYLTIAEMQIDEEQYEYAVDNCTMVLLLLDTENIKALVLRSRAFHAMKESDDAIADITRAIGLSDNDYELILERAQINLDYALYDDAINDYSIVLGIYAGSETSLKSRAYAYEQLGNKEMALNDYYVLLELLNKQEGKKELKKYTRSRIFELGKEDVKPELIVQSPVVNSNLELNVEEGVEEIAISGVINETSELKELRINNAPVSFKEESFGVYSYNYTIASENVDFVSITAVDIYGNVTTESYPIAYLETKPPIVELISPLAGTSGIIQLEKNDNTLYIEGRVIDKSHITSIKVDEVNASFAPGDYNPKFTATIDVRNRQNITVVAKDAFGNETKRVFEFAKEGQLLSDNNPMGKTWVIIIENTNYNEYTNLTSPAKDMATLKESLHRYQVSKILHKKNMTKREIERFFAIDLRDLIISNQVNSLLIWYAGHGQNVNDIGYWIPVDGRPNDEYSFYNVNALKASLYSYQSLTHTLVVSDACYAGESFTIAMRGTDNSLATCNDLELITKKSALVLTSSDEEAAMDNSLFTRTFANALANNPADCIPIDAIAERISLVMYKNTAQKPVFGRIAGLEDKSGTFFFVTR